MAGPMGLGLLGAPNLVFKRKYRWTFEVRELCVGPIPPYYVKLASRPQITIEEQEINYLHGRKYLPGKGTFEPITVTYYDVAGASGLENVYGWLASVFNFTDPVGLSQSSALGYAGLGILKLYDGCGTALEEWRFRGMWPQQVNFGELDYSSSEEVTIEVTLRYDTAEYIPHCGSPIRVCCTGCDGSGGGGGSPVQIADGPLVGDGSGFGGGGAGSGQRGGGGGGGGRWVPDGPPIFF